MTSVRGDRTTVSRARDDRDYDDGPRRTYTTIRRYQIPESSSGRSVVREENEETKEKIIIRRERKEDPPREREKEEVDVRVTERVVERDPRRDISYRIVERDVVRAPSPPDQDRVREFRFERDRDWSPPEERPYELERYSKSTEYYQQPQQIIIRERPAAPPIIIREERREPQRIIIRREEPQYEFIERKEVEEVKEESKSLVKREEPPPPAPVPEQKPEEDYFYERKIIERRRRSDSFDRRTEIRPRDSASQYSSDDSYEYVRRERTYEDRRSSSPHHKLHLAEGAIAGIGAAEIIRRHRKSRGEHPGGRGRDVLSGAAVGALGAEAISRVRSMRSLRRSSRSRSWSGDREPQDRRRRRSRSKSLSRVEKLGGLAAVAAVGALAGYALTNKNKKDTVVIKDVAPRRSRSRRRRGSYDSYLAGGAVDEKHRDPAHRNQVIASAGLVSAAAGALWERHRSKSRGGKPKTRIQQAIPVVATGLGGAALAGLYEKNKANQEAKKEAIIQDELGRGRRRRSRSRSVPAPYSDRGDAPRDMIAYGDDPVYSEGQNGYYSDEEPGVYRRRAGSADSSPDNRYRRSSRSRSRARDIAGVAAGAGAAGFAAHEYGKRRDRSRADRDRRRDEDARYDDGYGGQAPYSPPPMGNNQYGSNQQNNYPGGHYFPPPPTDDYAHNEPAYAQTGNNAYPAYNPADYANQPPHQPAYGTGAYGESTATLGQANPNDTFAGDHRYGAGYSDVPPHGADGRRGRDPENVSRNSHHDRRHREESLESDGVSTPRARSESRVRFDLDSNTMHPAEASRKSRHGRRSNRAVDDHDEIVTEDSGDEDRGSRKDRRGAPPRAESDRDRSRDRARSRSRSRDRDRDSRRDRDHGRNREPQRESTSTASSGGLMRDPYERSPDRNSDDTIDLPRRFDEHGNPTAEDKISKGFHDMLAGRGIAGGIFRSLAANLAKSAPGGDNDSEDGDQGKRSGNKKR